jgi:hypothetical protein
MIEMALIRLKREGYLQEGYAYEDLGSGQKMCYKVVPIPFLNLPEPLQKQIRDIENAEDISNITCPFCGANTAIRYVLKKTYVCAKCNYEVMGSGKGYDVKED